MAVLALPNENEQSLEKTGVAAADQGGAARKMRRLLNVQSASLYFV